MATLSITCPKCGKIHDRIKPQMAGYKVRCQCGFVFRLGPKESKDKLAFTREIKSKRRRKATSQKNSAYQERISPSPIQPELSPPTPFDPFGDDILDVIPDDPEDGGQFGNGC